jgi:hypothetical protein
MNAAIAERDCLKAAKGAKSGDIGGRIVDKAKALLAFDCRHFMNREFGCPTSGLRLCLQYSAGGEGPQKKGNG